MMNTRRDFLAGAAAMGLTAALPRILSAQQSPPPTTSPKKLGWAMVGIGRLTSDQLLPAIARCSQSRLAALVTGHPEKAAPLLKKCGLPSVPLYSYQDYDKLADNPDVDIIYIVLPNGMHAEYTVRGFKAGKHVLCEKPMAKTSTECQTMIDAGKTAGRQLMIAYRIRREPNNMKAIEICRSQQFGKLKMIVADHCFHLSDPTAWRLNKKLAGGGALMDVGIYCVNATRYLTGEEPVSITAQQVDNPTDPRFAQVEESVAWTTQFPSGVMATCTTSYNIAGTNRFRIMFEKGMIDMEPATGYHRIQTRLHPHDPDPLTLPDIDQFAVQMDYFSNCILQNQPNITPGEEGLKDLQIIQAIYESARTGKTIHLV